MSNVAYNFTDHKNSSVLWSSMTIRIMEKCCKIKLTVQVIN